MSQQPTFQITKEHFVGVINSLHQQYLKDKAGSDAFGQIFNAEAGLYDNSLLINSIFSFLHEVFPKDEDGFCNISHYCYECNFGKIGDNYESPEELFNRLFIKQNVSDIKPQNEFFIGAKAQDYPIVPEDAFLNGLDIKMDWVNASFEGKPNPNLNDEAGQFPGHNVSSFVSDVNKSPIPDSEFVITTKMRKEAETIIFKHPVISQEEGENKIIEKGLYYHPEGPQKNRPVNKWNFAKKIKPSFCHKGVIDHKILEKLNNPNFLKPSPDETA